MSTATIFCLINCWGGNNIDSQFTSLGNVAWITGSGTTVWTVKIMLYSSVKFSKSDIRNHYESNQDEEENICHMPLYDSIVCLHLEYLVQFCSPYQKGNDRPGKVSEKKNKDNWRYGMVFIQGKSESLYKEKLSHLRLFSVEKKSC